MPEARTEQVRAHGLSAGAERHRALRRALLAQDPSLRDLFGPEPMTLVFLCGLIGVHVGLAYCLREAQLYLVFASALLLGQFVLHAGGALVHEAAHGLVLRGRRGRLVVDVLLETLLTSFGHHAQYQLDHVCSHHPYLGDYERDYEHKDACRFWARASLRTERPHRHRGLIALQLFLDALPLGFLVSDDLVAALERRSVQLPTRDVKRSVPGPNLGKSRRIAYGLLSAFVLANVVRWLGPMSLLYWVWSLSLFQGRWGVSNVGQVLAEHPSGDPNTPTCSYYGPFNYILFNTGYHDEHHTFPNVAWNRLKTLRSRAPNAFQNQTERGYLSHWFGYVFRSAPRRPSEFLRAPGSRCLPQK